MIKYLIWLNPSVQIQWHWIISFSSQMTTILIMSMKSDIPFMGISDDRYIRYVYRLQIRMRIECKVTLRLLSEITDFPER